MEKWVRWILSLFLAVPLWFFILTLSGFNPLRDIGGLIFLLFIIAIAVVVPIWGLWLKQNWFRYYMYVLAPLGYIACIGVGWVISLFGDEYYSPFSIALWSAPLLIYFGAEIVLTIILQKCQRVDRQISTAK